MNFYTNVLQWGDTLLVREVKNGQRINKRVRYEPTLYDLVKTREKTGYQTLDGQSVKPHSFNSIREAKDWIENRSNQSDIVFGNTQYPYCYIGDTYKGSMDWDLDQILICLLYTSDAADEP